MAYLRAVNLTCYLPGCTRRATVELVNRFNASLGVYCAAHGKLRLRELQLLEVEQQDIEETNE